MVPGRNHVQWKEEPQHYIILLNHPVQSSESHPFKEFIHLLFREHDHRWSPMRAGERIPGPGKLLKQLSALIQGAERPCLDSPTAGNNTPHLLACIDAPWHPGAYDPSDNIPYLTGFDILPEEDGDCPYEKGPGTKCIDTKSLFRQKRESCGKRLAFSG